MGKLFGTDGIRGVVGENLTADMAFRVGQAVGTVLMEDKGSRPTVVIGKDTRISSDLLESALIAGFSKILAEKLIRLCGADTEDVLAAEQAKEE